MTKKKGKPRQTPNSSGVAVTLDRWTILAEQAEQRGAVGEAATYYAKIVAKEPHRAPIWHALAGLHYQAGKYRNALESLVRAVELEPDNVEYMSDLGGLYLTQGELLSAEAVLRSIVKLRPDFAHARYNLSDALYQQGKISEAIAELNRLIALEPDYAEAYFNLGIALRELGNTRSAKDAFQKSILLQPTNERAYLELARLQAELQYLPESIANYRKYVGIVPGDAEAVVALARVLHRNGETDEAINCLDLFSQSSQTNQRIGICRGEILHNAGQIKDAELAFISVLEGFPTATTAAAVGLSRLRRFTQSDDAVIQKLFVSLEAISDNDGAAAPIHFALGKIFDDLGQFDKAFRHYDAGNGIVSKRRRYDKTEAEVEVEGILAVFTTSLLERYKHVAAESEKPLLIVGMPRSGTTLTEQIIASHKDAVGAGELGFFPTLAAQLPRILGTHLGYPKCWEALNEAVTEEIVAQYASLLDRHGPTALRVTDKLPDNYRHIGLLRCLFKNARVIVCRRDPRDIALSIYFQYFRERHDYAWSLADIAHCYVQHERLVQHWLEVLPNGILQIEYADLILDNETTVRRILEFAGLDWDPKCLKFHTAKRDVKTASNWQVRQPIYTTSLARWEQYESHLKTYCRVLAQERLRFGINDRAYNSD